MAETKGFEPSMREAEINTILQAADFKIAKPN